MASLNFQGNCLIDLKVEHILNGKMIQELSVGQSMHLVVLNISAVVCLERL